MFEQIQMQILLLTVATFASGLETNPTSIANGTTLAPISAPTLIPSLMNCTAFQLALSKAGAELTDCMCRSSRPFTMCSQCLRSRARYQQLHDLLRKNDGKALGLATDGTNCRKYLMQLDSVQVLSRTRDFVESLWKRSNCDNCFSNDDGSSRPRYRREIDAFFNSTLQLRECFNNYSSLPSLIIANETDFSIVCDNCHNLYSALSAEFQSLTDAEPRTSTQTEHSLCMDAVDAMNATHRLWSEAFKCDIRLRSLQPLPLIIAAYITAVLFYVGARGKGEFKHRKLLRQKRLSCFASSSVSVSGSINASTSATAADH